MTESAASDAQIHEELAALRRRVAELQAREAELEIIAAVGRALAQKLDLQALIELAGDKIRDIFAADVVYLALYDAETQLIHFPYYSEAGEREFPESAALGQGLTSIVVQSRQPLLIGTFQQQLELGVLTDGRPSESWLGVPIVAGDEIAGAISVQSFQQHAFDAADIRLLATIAANVGVAIQNARLHAETRRRANEMAVLTEIGHDIATAPNLDQVLERIIAQAKELLRVRDIALYLHEPDTQTFRAAVVLGRYGEAIKAQPATLGRGIIGTVAHTGVAEVVNQPELDPRTVRIPGTPLPQEELEALMCAPLRSREKIMGLMAVWRPRAAGLFGPADLEFLVILARQAAIAIENARLYLETRRQAGEMAALADVGRDITATLDLPTVLERIASHARDLLAAGTTAVFLADTDGQAIRPIVVLGVGAAEIQAAAVTLGAGIIGDLAQRGVAEMINDTSSDPRADHAHGEPPPQQRRLMAAPLLVRRQVIGLMALWRAKEHNPFTPADLNFLVGLARQASIAIENARLFEEAQQARRAADAANLAKSTFLANMSHELRTPLNAVLGFAQVMERDPALSPQQREHLGIIARSGEHLLGLINDVLEMSKIEAGRIALNETAFDLRRMLQNTEELFRLRAEAKQLRLLFAIAPDVPSYVVGDESKLRQVLINLLGNAIKFTHKGGITLRVSSELRTIRSPELRTQNSNLKSQNWLRFEVEDTGEGIAAEQLPLLFQPFRQTASGLRAQEGTGLGLSIARQFVRLMGGDITVTSVHGAGARFTFDARVRPADAPDLPQVEVERHVIGLAHGERSDYRMLVVDDKPENRRLLVEWLRAVGFAVREAANGQQAIEEWERWAPHLIWMDVRMPVMDGYEATKRIKSSAKGQATVVIALTASAFEHEHTAVLSAGCDDFVRKPVREATIFAKIAEHLGVRFIYDDRPPPAEKAALVTAAALAGLPHDWLARLQQAADEVDAEMANAAIAQIRDRDIALADGLADLVANYRFDKLQLLLQEVSTHHDTV